MQGCKRFLTNGLPERISALEAHFLRIKAGNVSAFHVNETELENVFKQSGRD